MHPPLTRLYDEAGSLLAVLFPMLLAFLVAIVFSGCVAQYQKAEMEEEREIAQVLCPAAPIYMAPAPPSLITLALPPCGYSLPRLLTPSRCHHAAVHLVGVVHIPFRPRAVHAPTAAHRGVWSSSTWRRGSWR